MPQYLPLPDGSSVTIQDGESPLQAYERAKQMYPEAFAPKTPEGKPESGFVAATKAGLSGLKSDVAALAGRTGLMDEAAAEKYIEEQRKYQERTFKPTQTWGEAPLTKGLELFGGSLPYMAAPVAAGFAPGIAGLGLAGLTSAAQFTGSNLSRQMEEGKKLKETELGSAMLAAGPQAALDIVSFKMMPGIRGIFSAAGKEVTEAGAKQLAEQALSKVALDYAKATGKAMTAEGLTEAGQQVLERMQAGLNLTDEKARDEYWDSLVGGAVLGGALAPAGRFVERRREAKQNQPDQTEIDKARAEADAARAAEEARKAEPGYARQFVEDYEARKAEFVTAKNALKRPGKDATPDVWQAYNEQKKAVDAIRETLNKDAAEYNKLRPLAKAELDKAAEEERKAKLTPFEYAFGEVPEPPARETEAEKPYWEMEPAKSDKATVADYAAQRIELAKDQMPDPTVKDYADYIMQDPAKAQELLTARPRILGLSAKENEALMSGLKLQLAEREKQRAAGEADVYAQREADLAAQMPQAEPKNPLAKYFAGIEEQMNVPRSYVEPTFEYLDPLFEKALGGGEPLVKVPETLRPTRQAKLIRSKLDDMFNQLANFEEEVRAARRAGRNDYATELAFRANRIKEQLDAIANGTPSGELTAGLQGAGANETEAIAGYGQTIARLREAQDTAINDLQTAVDQLAKNEVIGKEQLNLLKEAPEEGRGQARATQGVLAKRAEDARSRFITSMLEEVAAHRRAEGRGTIGQEEALRYASEAYDQINELITRVQATPRRDNLEEVTVLPAQMRAGKVTRGAVTDMRDTRPLAERPFGAYQAAVDNILDNLRNIRDRAIGERPEGRRVEADLLRKQFPTTEATRIAEEKGETAPTLTGELRRHAEYSQNQLEKALTNPDLTDDIRAPLEQALDRIKDGKVSRELLDSVDNIADRIISGRVYGSKNVVRPAQPGRVFTVGKTKGQVSLIGSDPYRRGRDRVPVYTGGMEQELQELQDIMRASEPSAREQIEAGQQQLGLMFEEPGKPARKIESDLGYIRMTPENFAKSPRMKPVWEALAKARARQASQEGKKAAKTRLEKAAMETITRLKAKMDNIKADTKFFHQDMTKWSDEEMAKVFVGFPELGTTPEEVSLMERYLRKETLTPEEREQVFKIERHHREKVMPLYEAKLKEAKALLATGQRLDDIDNQLLEHMQSTNANVKKAAQALDKELAVYRNVLKAIEAVFKKAPLSKAERAVITQMNKVRAQNNRYHATVEKALTRAKADMSQALGELLDPNINQLQDQLNKAKAALAKEEAELDRVNVNLLNVLSQEEGANRSELATYELFKYEEKQGIIDDLRRQIETAQDELFEFQAERSLEFDGALAAAQAMMDSRVTQEREKLARLEAQLADMRGDTVGKKPAQYPFAYQMLEAQERQQRKIAEDAKKEADALEKQAKQQQQEIYEELLAAERESVEADKAAAKTKLATAQERLKQVDKDLKKKTLPADTRNALQKERFKLNRTIEQQEAIIRGKPLETGKQVVRDYATGTYKADPVLTAAEKEAKKRAEDAKQAEIDAAAVAKKEADLSAKEREIDARLDDLYEEFAQLPGSTSADKLASIMADENSTAPDRDAATLKLGVLQQIRSAEAELQALREPKPRRKPRAATGPSTSALTKAKPFRTGRLPNLGEAPEAAGLEDVYTSNFGTARTSVRYEGDEPNVFRTAAKAGPSLKEQTVKNMVDKIMQGWKITPEVKVVADESGLPENIRAQAEAQGKIGQIPGLYDPNTKTVYLVASGLKDANDVVMTVAHEVAGHFGLREMLGAAYAKNMNRLYDGNKLVKERADAKMAEDPKLSREVAVEEVLADMAETGATPQERNILARVYDFIKRWLASKIPALKIDTVTDNDVKQVVANARRYVIEGEGKVEGGTAKTDGLLYRTAQYASPEMEAAGKALDPFVTKQRGMAEKVKANATGLAFETMLVDRFTGFERLSKYLPEHRGSQMMFFLRMYDQRMNMVSQAVAAGAPTIREVKRPDGKTERIIEAKEGANIKNVVNILKEANPMVGNAEAVNRLFTAYMAAIRADNKGFASLNFGEDVTREDLDKALSVVNNNQKLKDIFDKARGEYNEYNRNLIQFLVETGAMSKKVADRLTAENDYIPFYREQNGVAQLLIGGEAPIRIGSIKEQPYLKELVGGDQPILDFLTSSVQNTNMLVDMGMRNLATKNAVFELINLNAAKLVKGTPSGKDVVKFKIDGEDRYAVLATEKVTIGNKTFDTGVPADILVKGMEGIPTQMPFIFRAMAMPAQLLRKGVTLSPLYMAGQLFRDSLAAPILSGADFTPVLGALKELNGTTAKTLERRGITGGQQFKGTSEDLSMILREVASGKPGWMTVLGKFEAAAVEADAATRRAQYNSYIEQGLSEMEATLMALESMNFNKRGASPSVHIANALIPFFNAQIQGLNVLYKAMMGKMPFNDKLKIRQKMLERGGMMAVAAMAYAVMMQDDEAYQNAEPEQKYGNWFLRFPGLDEPLKLPVPFEVGYIFKALPEAIVNTMLSEHGGEEAVKAFKQIVLQTIPGGSSYGIPQALKPAIEVGLGKSFYTGRDILSAREKELLPEEQFRANTTEMAKAFGKLTGASPILMEQLVRGYTGTMGLAFLQALSVGVPSGESPEGAVKRLSEYPIVGGAFQPNDAGGIINSVYERMNEAQKVEKTYEKLISEGRTADAEALLQRRGNEFMQAELAKEFKSNMNELIQAERAIQASAMSGEEKRKQLDEIRKLKIAVAKEIRDVADKTIHLSFSL